MKIYKISIDLSLVLQRLKRFQLYEYQHSHPTIFVEANNPDEACHKAYYTLASIILKQDPSKKTSRLIKDIFNDITILKVQIPDEEKL